MVNHPPITDDRFSDADRKNDAGASFVLQSKGNVNKTLITTIVFFFFSILWMIDNSEISICC